MTLNKNSEKLGLFSGYYGQGGFVRGSVIRIGPSEGYIGFWQLGRRGAFRQITARAKAEKATMNR